MTALSIFYIVCLTITLMTLEILIVSGFRSVNHRLLPLVLGLVALYEIYLIVEYKTGITEAFDILEDLLLVFLLNLVFYYVVDFMELKLPEFVHGIILSGIALMVIYICSGPYSDPFHKKVIITYTCISVLVTLASMLIASKSRVFSKREKHNNLIVFWAMFVPSVVLIPSILDLIPVYIAMPIVFTLICIVLDIFFVTDRLRDVSSCLKEELFHTLDESAVLFDADLCYIDASETAKLSFPEIIKAMEENPDHYRNKFIIEEFREQGGATELQYRGVYYSVILQEAFYNNKMQGYILRFTDITAQKMEAENYRYITKQKSEFLANMSHDLRSPLHAILGGSEIILSRREISAQGRAMANRIHEAGENLLDMVNSILDFSKLESGNLVFHPKEYNFKRLVESVAQMGFATLESNNVNFSVEIPEGFPEYMYGDELRVRQILQNVMSNAIKFTEEGSVKCVLRIQTTLDNRIRVEYSVTDTGIGMSPKQLETIFGDYVTYAGDQKKEGTGLGLSIVRKLSEMMGGHASAESVEGEGSTISAVFLQDFTATFWKNGGHMHEPLFISEIDQIGVDRIWTNTVFPNFTYPAARVLIVDDLEFNRVIMRELLSPWEFEIDEAENGLIAVQKVREGEYDLVIMDQMMPVMTGTEAADEIKQFSSVPMILLTANITEDMRTESYEHGFKAYLQKPVETKDLKVAIEEYLPAELRMPYIASVIGNAPAGNLPDKSYFKALTSYLNEMKQLSEVLGDYARNDLDTFRNKVHGIKGVSKQFGKLTLGMSAEIMEMAATTQNITFIRNFFDSFYSDLTITITELEAEWKNLNATLEQEEVMSEQTGEKTEKKTVDSEEFRGYLEQLKEALETSDIDAIEICITTIREIGQIDGSPEVPSKSFSMEELLDILKKIEAFIDEFEYEDALELFLEYYNQL